MSSNEQTVPVPVEPAKKAEKPAQENKQDTDIQEIDPDNTEVPTSSSEVKKSQDADNIINNTVNINNAPKPSADSNMFNNLKQMDNPSDNISNEQENKLGNEMEQDEKKIEPIQNYVTWEEADNLAKLTWKLLSERFADIYKNHRLKLNQIDKFWESSLFTKVRRYMVEADQSRGGKDRSNKMNLLFRGEKQNFHVQSWKQYLHFLNQLIEGTIEFYKDYKNSKQWRDVKRTRKTPIGTPDLYIKQLQDEQKKLQSLSLYILYRKGLDQTLNKEELWKENEEKYAKFNALKKQREDKRQKIKEETTLSGLKQKLNYEQPEDTKRIEQKTRHIKEWQDNVRKILNKDKIKVIEPSSSEYQQIVKDLKDKIEQEFNKDKNIPESKMQKAAEEMVQAANLDQQEQDKIINQQIEEMTQYNTPEEMEIEEEEPEPDDKIQPDEAKKMFADKRYTISNLAKEDKKTAKELEERFKKIKKIDFDFSDVIFKTRSREYLDDTIFNEPRRSNELKALLQFKEYKYDTTNQKLLFLKGAFDDDFIKLVEKHEKQLDEIWPESDIDNINLVIDPTDPKQKVEEFKNQVKYLKDQLEKYDEKHRKEEDVEMQADEEINALTKSFSSIPVQKKQEETEEEKNEKKQKEDLKKDIEKLLGYKPPDIDKQSLNNLLGAKNQIKKYETIKEHLMEFIDKFGLGPNYAYKLKQDFNEKIFGNETEVQKLFDDVTTKMQGLFLSKHNATINDQTEYFKLIPNNVIQEKGLKLFGFKAEDLKPPNTKELQKQLADIEKNVTTLKSIHTELKNKRNAIETKIQRIRNNGVSEKEQLQLQTIEQELQSDTIAKLDENIKNLDKWTQEHEKRKANIPKLKQDYTIKYGEWLNFLRKNDYKEKLDEDKKLKATPNNIKEATKNMNDYQQEQYYKEQEQYLDSVRQEVEDQNKIKENTRIQEIKKEIDKQRSIYKKYNGEEAPDEKFDTIKELESYKEKITKDALIKKKEHDTLSSQFVQTRRDAIRVDPSLEDQLNTKNFPYPQLPNKQIEDKIRELNEHIKDKQDEKVKVDLPMKKNEFIREAEEIKKMDKSLAPKIQDIIQSIKFFNGSPEELTKQFASLDKDYTNLLKRTQDKRYKIKNILDGIQDYNERLPPSKQYDSKLNEDEVDDIEEIGELEYIELKQQAILTRLQDRYKRYLESEDRTYTEQQRQKALTEKEELEKRRIQDKEERAIAKEQEEENKRTKKENLEIEVMRGKQQDYLNRLRLNNITPTFELQRPINSLKDEGILEYLEDEMKAVGDTLRFKQKYKDDYKQLDHIDREILKEIGTPPAYNAIDDADNARSAKLYQQLEDYLKEAKAKEKEKNTLELYYKDLDQVRTQIAKITGQNKNDIYSGKFTNIHEAKITQRRALEELEEAKRNLADSKYEKETMLKEIDEIRSKYPLKAWQISEEERKLRKEKINTLEDAYRQKQELEFIREKEEERLEKQKQIDFAKDDYDQLYKGFQDLIRDPSLIYGVMKNAAAGKDIKNIPGVENPLPKQAKRLMDLAREMFEFTARSNFLPYSSKNKYAVEQFTREMYDKFKDIEFTGYEDYKDAEESKFYSPGESTFRQDATAQNLYEDPKQAQIYLLSLALDLQNNNVVPERENLAKFYAALKGARANFADFDWNTKSKAELFKRLLDRVPVNLANPKFLQEQIAALSKSVHDENRESFQRQHATQVYQKDIKLLDSDLDLTPIGDYSVPSMKSKIKGLEAKYPQGQLHRLDFLTGNYMPASKNKLQKGEFYVWNNKPGKPKANKALAKQIAIGKYGFGQNALRFAEDKTKGALTKRMYPDLSALSMIGFKNKINKLVPAKQQFINQQRNKKSFNSAKAKEIYNELRKEKKQKKKLNKKLKKKKKFPTKKHKTEILNKQKSKKKSKKKQTKSEQKEKDEEK